MAEKQIKQVFRRPREGERLPAPDPMTEFSALYHLEAERRRSRLSRKYGVGYWMRSMSKRKMICSARRGAFRSLAMMGISQVAREV